MHFLDRVRERVGADWNMEDVEQIVSGLGATTKTDWETLNGHDVHLIRHKGVEVYAVVDGAYLITAITPDQFIRSFSVRKRGMR